MTSIEVPYSIAAALPTLSVMDITNDVSQVGRPSGRSDGIAYIHATHGLSLVRVQERETGFFEDLEVDAGARRPRRHAAKRERLVARCSARARSRCRSPTARCASDSGSGSCSSPSTPSIATTGR